MCRHVAVRSCLRVSFHLQGSAVVSPLQVWQSVFLPWRSSDLVHVREEACEGARLQPHLWFSCPGLLTEALCSSSSDFLKEAEMVGFGPLLAVAGGGSSVTAFAVSH